MNTTYDEAIYMQEWLGAKIYNTLNAYYNNEIEADEYIDMVESLCDEAITYYEKKYDTDGVTEEIRKRILEQNYMIFKRQNNIVAANVCIAQGKKYTKLYNENANYCYYDSEFYYNNITVEENIKERLMIVAKIWDVEDLDFLR